MVTPVAVRDGVLTPVVSCWPAKAVGAKNASGEKQVNTPQGVMVHVFMKVMYMR